METLPKLRGELKHKLSNREMEILKLRWEGKTAREIGHILFLSLRTVQNHLHHLKLRMGFKTGVQLYHWGLQEGYLTLPEKDHSEEST